MSYQSLALKFSLARKSIITIIIRFVSIYLFNLCI